MTAKSRGSASAEFVTDEREDLERATRCTDAGMSSRLRASTQPSVTPCNANGDELELDSALQVRAADAPPPTHCFTGDNTSAKPQHGTEAEVFLSSGFFKTIKVLGMIGVLAYSFMYLSTKETVSMVPLSACGRCFTCQTLFTLDAQSLSDVKYVLAVATPSWAGGDSFSQPIALEGNFSVVEVSQRDKIYLTSVPSGMIMHTEGVIFPFQGLVQALDRLVFQPGIGAGEWDFSRMETATQTVLASNDSFLGVLSDAGPLQYGGAPVTYAAIANAHTVELSLSGPAPTFEERFRLQCTARVFSSEESSDIQVSSYPFPGKAPSLTRVTATLKWLNSTLTASCAATIRDGPELPFFAATSTAAAAPAYECATRMSIYAALFTAISHAVAFRGAFASAVTVLGKHGPPFRKKVWGYLSFIRSNGFLESFLASLRSRALLPGGRSISLPLLLLLLCGGLVTMVFFVTQLDPMRIWSSGESSLIDPQCSCSFGTCAPENKTFCVSCTEGYELLPGEGQCVPIRCACDNGVCAPGQPNVCSACAEAFRLTDHGKCEASVCQCANGNCGATTSYCTSCHDGFALRSTGRPALDTPRGGYFFTTPICIEELVNQTSRIAGGV